MTSPARALASKAFLFGGDYNPEQWTEDVWLEDIALMRQAGVNAATIGVFSWSMLEPEEGVYTFEWLDRIIELLHDGGIGVILATPTASPPPWFSLAHPDALPVDERGAQLWHGSRDTYCPSAPAYRDASRSIAAALARAVRRPPGRHRLARAQRVRHVLLLRSRRVRVPRLAAAPVPDPRRAECRLVHGVLEPGLPPLGGDPAAQGHPVPAQSHAGRRFPALHVGRIPGLLARAGGGDPTGRLHRPDHHELHAAHLESHRAVELGGGTRRGVDRSLPRHHRR